MLKEAGEAVKAVLEFFGRPKLVAALFLASAAWMVPAIRQFLPVQRAAAEGAGLVTSIIFTVSGAYLVVNIATWLLQQIKAWKNSPERLLKKALRNATPLEKCVLEAVIHKGEYLLKLDAGSAIAVHLQQIGLIGRASGLPYTTYQLARGLADLCIKNPALLEVPAEQEKAALDELEGWRKQGCHKSFFFQLERPNERSWMS